MRYVIVYGDEADGYTVVGPFETLDEAIDYVDSDPEGRGYIAEFYSPSKGH